MVSVYFEPATHGKRIIDQSAEPWLRRTSCSNDLAEPLQVPGPCDLTAQGWSPACGNRVACALSQRVAYTRAPGAASEAQQSRPFALYISHSQGGRRPSFNLDPR